jgi:hypothetical protein
MATEKRVTTPERRNYWHYRRTPATRYRDAVWQYANRPTDGVWETIPTPATDVLERLERKGTMSDMRIRWIGFHDPAEYDQGY